MWSSQAQGMLLPQASEVLRVWGAGCASSLPSLGKGKSQHHRGISNLGTGGVRHCSFSPGLRDSELRGLLWRAGCQLGLFFGWFMELLRRTGEAPHHLQAHLQGSDPIGAWGPFPPFGENGIWLLLGWGWWSPKPIPDGLERDHRHQGGREDGRKEKGCTFPRRLFVLFGFNCTPEPVVLNIPN